MNRIVNDFSINIATANGTGSQSANLIIMQTMFDMGVGSSGKNLFPSNISGLPTWYLIRVSDSNYQAPGSETHIQILMNKATWEDDLSKLKPGSSVIYNSDVKMPIEREDLVLYPVPMTKMGRSLNPKLGKMIANVVYVGVLVELLSMDVEIMKNAIAKQFKGKDKAIELNIQAAMMGIEYAQNELTKNDHYVIESRERNDSEFMIDGNEAIALGAIFGGITMMSWYPITPSSSVAESL